MACHVCRVPAVRSGEGAQLTKEEAQLEIGKIADALLTGALSYVEAARKFHSLCFIAGLEHDPDLRTFEAIDSETDALPVGAVREHWNPEALAKIQPEIERAEAWAYAFGLESARRLAARFGRQTAK